MLTYTTMTKLRLTVSTLLLAMCSFALTLYSSCTGKCEKISCQNGGACKKGACVCPDGYQGTLCETLADPCASVECMNGGTCKNGTCDCPPGYEGTKCQTISRLKYIRAWQCSHAYHFYVTSGSSAVQVKIMNFAHIALTEITAIINGNTITVSSQNAGTSGKIVQGSGIFDPVNNSITWTYTITTQPGQPQEYTETWHPG